mgnify:CR=1 FL=1
MVYNSINIILYYSSYFIKKKFFKNIKLLEKNGCESISHRLFDGMRHDIIFEKNNAVVWKDIAKTLFSWVDRYNDSHEVIQTE